MAALASQFSLSLTPLLDLCDLRCASPLLKQLETKMEEARRCTKSRGLTTPKRVLFFLCSLTYSAVLGLFSLLSDERKKVWQEEEAEEEFHHETTATTTENNDIVA